MFQAEGIVVKKHWVRSMLGGSRNSKERLCDDVEGARVRMVGNEFIIYLMNDSECIIEVKSMGPS